MEVRVVLNIRTFKVYIKMDEEKREEMKWHNVMVVKILSCHLYSALY